MLVRFLQHLGRQLHISAVMDYPRIIWPEGKRFAFSVFDDCDLMTLHNGPAVYDFLYDLGMLTTKSVWPIKGKENPSIGGETCENPEYLAWVLSLQKKGYEIGLHNVTYHSSKRVDVVRGLDTFAQHFGHRPRIHANHNNCQDALYWGKYRLSGIRQTLYSLCRSFEHKRVFSGHIENTDHFWGDLCRESITYVRNFVYPDINTLRVCPSMPYFDPERPYVPYWFASAGGPDARSFCATIAEQHQDRLEEEGGACIMYTHFGSDFYRDGCLDPLFVQRMKRLRARNGWFVPVSTLLDHLRAQRPRQEHISPADRARLEWRWLMHKTRVGTT
jgi:hypothetical protein